jgi:hypothetical protein
MCQLYLYQGSSTQVFMYHVSCIMYHVKIFICRWILAGRGASPLHSAHQRQEAGRRGSPLLLATSQQAGAQRPHYILYSLQDQGSVPGTYRQCCGTGTVATVTFCRRGTGIGTVINYGSGTGSKIVVK